MPRAVILFLLLAAPLAAHPPYAIAVDAGGRVFFLDWANRRVMQVTPEGRIRELADLGPHTETHPHALVLDARGRLLLAATYEPYIWSISRDGEVGVHYRGPEDQERQHAVLKLTASPGGGLLAVLWDHAVGERGVLEDDRFRIVRLSPEGDLGERLFACRKGRPGFLPLYGGSMTCARDGRLYLSCRRRIWRLDPEEGPVAIAGASEEGRRDGRGAEARFALPWGMAATEEGDLVVADLQNHQLRRVTPEGAVTTLAGTGAYGGADGPAREAGFAEVYAVATRDGEIYAAEFDPRHGEKGRHRIRKIGADGRVATLAVLEQE